ncbi:MAG: glucose-1-phosphate adenylyltransferase [Bacteroidetes bacterium]|nr:glucose-1-phosphate adenylyltransferase [Bacteroidota bacterium]MCH8244817.1 glucose-1-phosphate adenylyltransferase [Bacteroidota bacterium]
MSIVAIILGGGAGTRLFPLTQRRAKPAVPVAGKYRLIDIPLSNCINSGINTVFVLTQYNSASLNRHVAQTYRFDRFRHGSVNILAAEQTPGSTEWFQGTADAVRQSMQHVALYRKEHVLVLSGDQLYTMDYRKMLAHHIEHGADITIASIPVTRQEVPDFGILKTTPEHRITEFYEKPNPENVPGLESSVSDTMKAEGRQYLASMGIYIFSKGVLAGLLEERTDSHDFGREIIPYSIGTHKVYSYPFEGYWSDIGTIKSFYEANLMLARPSPPFDIYDPKMPLHTNPRTLPPAKIIESNITESLIAEATVIFASSISNSVIGLRSFIGSGCTIRDSILMGSDYFRWHDPSVRPTDEGPPEPGIDSGTVIEGAIIDRNVSIGKRCVIRNSENVSEYDGENYYIRDGILIVPKNALIPDDTKL